MPNDPRASVFYKESSSGHQGWTLPKEFTASFTELVGKPFLRRYIVLSDLREWIIHFFGALPDGEQLPSAKAVVRDLLEVDVGSDLDEKVEALEAWKVAALLADASLINPRILKLAMKASSKWKAGAPELRRPDRDDNADQEGPRPPTPPQSPPISPRRAAVDDGAALRLELGALRQAVAELQSVKKGAPSESTLRSFVAEAKNVLDWKGQMAVDPETLVRDLDVAYVAGRRHLPGGDLLHDTFTRLKCWLISAATTDGWESCPEQVKLGNDLLLDLRAQRVYVEEGISRKSVMRGLQQLTDDPFDKVVAGIRGQREKSERPRRQYKKSQGNGKAGGKH
ncbi:hypothetical protein DIPPA_24781 [Diplonema papillatum]|nr:hypothetical protein DIPPA_21474 [Diplonema papillatum]KAJ9455125.1 hypothetical protein DIPPA_31428 [Diplonema papillatum]KAJ9464518.1 hypothetical protein DIPPA_24781 [Diplonema papillatum]